MPTRCCNLVLADVRNYITAGIEPEPGLNALVGRNGQGKTNLLEAIHITATGRPLRGRKEAQVVRFGADRAHLRATFEPPETEVEVTLPLAGRKSVVVNGAHLRRSSDLAGRVPCVCFTSGSLSVVDGTPEDRRHFLDTESAQLYPAYVSTLAMYKRALLQRNAVLRAWREEGGPEPAALDSWEGTLATYGAQVRLHRRRWAEELLAELPDAFSRIGGAERAGLGYAPGDLAESPGELAGMLRAGRLRDRDRGSTQAGPHRDELELTLDGADARDFASQGQRRGIVLALKLAVFRRIAQGSRRLPILLLDDVFSDLDASRRSALMEETLQVGAQVVVTGTEPELLGAEALRSAAVFRVTSGTVARE